jgi:predicted benzoate:H+ symporter BenE
VAATGAILGVILLVLALSGAIERLSRAIPQSVIAGLRLGLGLSFALLGLKLIAELPWLGLPILVLVAGLTLLRGCPATLIALAAALLAGQALGLAPPLGEVAPTFALPGLVLPSLADLGQALQLAVLPQIALTVTNAVIVTAALARSLFPQAAGRASERRLCLTSGLVNLLLAPFGALLRSAHRSGCADVVPALSCAASGGLVKNDCRAGAAHIAGQAERGQAPPDSQPEARRRHSRAGSPAPSIR